MNAQCTPPADAPISHIAAFYPFDEVNGSRVMLDPQGPNRWDISSIMAYGHPKTQDSIRDAIKASSRDSDTAVKLQFLRELPHVPSWVFNWEGEFELEITRPLSGANLDDVVRERTRYVARFYPQAWQGDEAVAVDNEGPVLWEVTSLIENERDPRVRAEMTAGFCEAADALVQAPNAPQWARTWAGPFEIRVLVIEPHLPMPRWCLFEDHVAVPADEAAVATLRDSIPDSDGRYGRGFRDALESIALALKQEGVRSQHIASALETAVQAYGNNADRTLPDVIEEMLVVSLAHLDAYERGIEDMADMQRLGIPHLIPCFTSDAGLVVNVPGPDVIDPGVLLAELEGKVTGGFSTCVMRAIQTGASYLYFDRDVEPMEGCPVYDDQGNSEIRRA